MPSTVSCTVGYEQVHSKPVSHVDCTALYCTVLYLYLHLYMFIPNLFDFVQVLVLYSNYICTVVYILHGTVLYCMLYCTARHCAVLHCTAWHCTTLSRMVLHCTVLQSGMDGVLALYCGWHDVIMSSRAETEQKWYTTEQTRSQS